MQLLDHCAGELIAKKNQSARLHLLMLLYLIRAEVENKPLVGVLNSTR